MGYKSIDGLMRHLRNSGIVIAGSTQKRQLMNTGYFHGYKGYRFFEHSGNRLPFATYEEVYATIQFDSQLKALFYAKMMFIETAVKNIALECILEKAKSENIQDIFNRAVCGYKNAPVASDPEAKKKFQKTSYPCKVWFNRICPKPMLPAIPKLPISITIWGIVTCQFGRLWKL